MVSREKQICQHQLVRQELLAKEAPQGEEVVGQQGILMDTREAIHRQDNRVILTVLGGMAVMVVVEAKVEELTHPLQGDLAEMEEEVEMEEVEEIRLPQRWAHLGVTAEMVVKVGQAVGQP
ncbi:hypothetical protein S780_20455 [Salmonella enterica]|nr:hypothetical protein [Salmonella enterica subsp. enterica serovar Louisiana]EBY2850391.1 hypothetical protein [Salmonella enterica subsp. enterica serovar Plymouth]ECA1252952.1 hypothetical protein [Salmonella enterica subsp. enterica serovar Chailey]ECB1045737.1 hypothetical protein [Salmonella enterica subsp. enterica serovar Aschersleben]MID13390.1 hypothetical protein [Salmonella enterica]